MTFFPPSKMSRGFFFCHGRTDMNNSNVEPHRVHAATTMKWKFPLKRDSSKWFIYTNIVFLSQLSLLMFAALCSLYTTLHTCYVPQSCFTLNYCICINIHLWTTSLRALETVIHATCRRREMVILESVLNAKKKKKWRSDALHISSKTFTWFIFTAARTISLLRKVRVGQRDIAACKWRAAFGRFNRRDWVIW